MRSEACDNYLVTAVATASPQKLHLMLIEAAIRSAERARQSWAAGRDDEALGSIVHAQEVVNEMICSLDRESATDLVRQVTSVYLFVFRSLVEAGHHKNQESLADAVRVLEIERETWRQVCQGEATAEETPAAAPVGPPAPHITTGMMPEDDLGPWTEGGLSLEA